MKETIVNPLITKALHSIYDLDVDGEVHNSKTVKTLHFEYPGSVFFEPVFLNFIKNVEFQYIYLTDGSNIKEDEVYLKLNKQSFIDFIQNNELYASEARGTLFQFENYSLMGMTIFDDNFEWLIHNNVDIEDITFSYQFAKFKDENALEILKKSEWYIKK